MSWVGVMIGMAALGLVGWLLQSFSNSLGRRSYWVVLYSFAFVAFMMSAESIQGYLNGFVLVVLAFAALVVALTIAPSSSGASR